VLYIIVNKKSIKRFLVYIMTHVCL